MIVFLGALALFATVVGTVGLKVQATIARRRAQPNYQTVRNAVMTQRGRARLEVSDGETRPAPKP